jgi:two-component system NtrC family response regulator
LFEFLVDYDWPGNVRELINAMEGAIMTAQGEPTLYPKHLPTPIRIHKARSSVKKQGNHQNGDPGGSDLLSELSHFSDFREATLLEAGRRYFGRLMMTSGGDIREACRLSGLSRARLYALLKSHGIARSG